MKTTQILILLGLVSLLGIWYFLEQSNNKNGETSSIMRMDFSVIDTSQIDELRLSSKVPLETILTRKNKTWLVNNKHKAIPQRIISLLGTLHDMEVKSHVAPNRKERVLAYMASSAIKVEVLSKGEHIKTFYVGQDTDNLLGTYMLLSGSSDPFVLHVPSHNGFLSSRFDIYWENWRDKEIIDIPAEEISSVQMQYFEQPQNGFTITQSQQGALSLQDALGNPVDQANSIALRTYISSFRDVYCESFVQKSDAIAPAEIDRLPPVFKLIILQNDGSKKEIVARKRKTRFDAGGQEVQSKEDKDRMYASDGTDYFLIQYYVFNKFLQASEFFVETSTSNSKA